MHYLAAYRFVFTSPGWQRSLLLASVLQLVPVLGPVALLGYAFDVLEALHRGGERARPTFEFPRFLAYVARGLIPLVVYLPVVFLLGIFGFFGAVVVWESRIPARAVSTLMALVVIAFLVLLVLGLFLVPLSLRAGLTQVLDVPASLEFVRDFLKRVWKEVFLAWLFVLVTGQLLLLAGAALFWLGACPALVLAVLAQHHLMYQLYELYLRRGGSELLPIASPTREQGLLRSVR